MKWVILIPLLAMITSCGVFTKKSSSSFKEKQAYSISKKSDVKKGSILNESALTLDKSEINKKNNNRIIIYPKIGSKVTIGEDGSVTGEIDSVVKNFNESTQQLNNIIGDLNRTLQNTSDSTGQEDSKAEEEVVIKEKVKTPDKGSITIIYVIIGIVVVVIVIIVLNKLI